MHNADRDRNWAEAGQETERLIAAISRDSQEAVRYESLRILNDCIEPDVETSPRTGLIVGYVQSGKTLSFTTVAALASDNRYQLVIVLSGSSVILQTQSTKRLRRDLGIDQRRSASRWSVFESSKLRGASSLDLLRTALRRSLDDRRRGVQPKTILVSVLKERTHLLKLLQFFSTCGLPLEQLTSLIIDDEADQAGLNNAVRQGEESRIYSLLLQLRRQLPVHSYLQYTATPQATLLISIADILSPSFVHVLTPGHSYTGGMTFFSERLLNLVIPIPPNQVFDDKNLPIEPPDCLLEALRIFFLGVADHLLEPESPAKPHNRSMMVHPSRGKVVHQRFCQWVSTIKDRWEHELAEGGDERDRQELLQDFRSSYENLRTTLPNLRDFDELAQQLADAIAYSVITEVNTRTQLRAIEDQDEFWNHQYHILVGGDQLSRGFTVEGLTVTYMPRNLGVGNADTIQQRARWFGYKDDYIGYCRVYLPQPSIDAFAEYVQHEEHLRETLRGIDGPLSEWRRRFFLDPLFQPTRRAVLEYGLHRGMFGRNNWFVQQEPHLDGPLAARNLQAFEDFTSTVGFVRDDTGQHLLAEDVSLRSVYSHLLLHCVMFSAGDMDRFLGLLLQIEDHLASVGDEPCTIYKMSVDRNGRWSYRGRTPLKFATDPDATVINPLQGPSKNYPGDRRLHSRNAVTIQLHKLRVPDATNGITCGSLCVWLPTRLARPYIVQESPPAT